MTTLVVLSAGIRNVRIKKRESKIFFSSFDSQPRLAVEQTWGRIHNTSSSL